MPSDCNTVKLLQVGMAATLASVSSVPLTSVLLLFELTKDYRILLPLMVISFLILLMYYSLFYLIAYLVCESCKGLTNLFQGSPSLFQFFDILFILSQFHRIGGKEGMGMTEQRKGYSHLLDVDQKGGKN